MPEGRTPYLSRNRIVLLSLVVLALAGGLFVWWSGPDRLETSEPEALAQAPAAEPTPQPGAAAAKPAAPKGRPAELSEAERITRLQHAIDADQAQLEAVKTQLEGCNCDYEEAEQDFKKVDAELAAKKKQCQQLQAAGKKQEAAAADADLEVIEIEWLWHRDRFDLEIKKRKTHQEKMAVLQKKIQQNRQAMEALAGARVKPAAETTAVTGPTPEPATKAPAVAAAPPAATESAPATAGTKPSKELLKAREDVRRKELAMKDAQDRAAAVAERIDAVRKNIELEQQLQLTAQRRADQERAAQDKLRTRVQRATVEDPNGPAVQALLQDLARAEQRHADALAEQRASDERLADLQTELNELHADQLGVLRDAEARKREASAAEGRLAHLENPLTLANALQWLLHNGPRLLAILVAMLVAHLAVKLFSSRVVKLMARRAAAARGSDEEGENRAQTLVGVFRNAASLVIFGGGSLMLLDSVGIPIVPLMGGAAVVGLAVAFGAQNLIRDYFCGFMVLLEDQYSINDVVKIGEISGTVEKITLRMTVLRSHDGVVHFVPHGTITTVSNKTHGWSRAFFEIGVAYREDVDRVMAVLVELGKGLRQDEEFAPLILDDPEMLGVDSFEDSCVVVKFYIKTRPMQQWPVKRELLRRIKRKFDEVGIEIPFPHRTVYHRYESEQQPRPADHRAA